MRTHITKSLQTRCKAIQSAITALNNAAAALNPPRPPINWTEIGGYQFLEQFTLLQDTRNDIRSARWTQPAVRSAMKLRNRISRAKEEISRLNIEVRRLHTAIRDERSLFNATLKRLKDTNDPLHGPTKEYVNRRRQMNHHLLSRIHEIYGLPGFSGIKGPGTRVGSTVKAGDTPDTDPDFVPDDDAARDDDVDILEGDEEQAALAHVVKFISELGISND